MGIRYLLILALRYNNCGRGSYEFTKRTRVAAPIGLVAFFATMPIYSPNIVPLFSALTDSDLTGHLYGLL